MQCRIGGVEQAGEVAAAGVAGGCNTDGGGDAQWCGGVAAGDGPGGETGPEPFGYLEGSGGAGGQEDSELFAVEPADHVIGPQALAEDAGDFGERGVPPGGRGCC